MADMNQEPTRIDLDDWELFGGGGNGLSYNHREDDTLVLKMNKASLPEEHTRQEFLLSRSLYEMGVNCPKVIDFVFDGERYGLVVEKVKDKKSFARIISEDPSQLEPLARAFARNARQLHSVRCGNGPVPSFREYYLNGLSDCKALSDKEKRILRDALDSMDDEDFCLHGDLTPGNIIRAGGKDYWIDLGEVTYGDPDIDFGYMMFISDHIPKKLVPYLYHISRKQFREFTRIFGQEYYGDRWGTPELNAKLHNVLLIKAGNSILKRPKAALIYRPLIGGRKLRYTLLRALMNLLVREIRIS